MVYFFSVDVFVGDTPGIWLDDTSLMIETTEQFLPEQEDCLQSPINDNVHSVINVCLSSSLMHLFLVDFECQLSQ